MIRKKAFITFVFLFLCLVQTSFSLFRSPGTSYLCGDLSYIQDSFVLEETETQVFLFYSSSNSIIILTKNTDITPEDKDRLRGVDFCTSGHLRRCSGGSSASLLGSVPDRYLSSCGVVTNIEQGVEGVVFVTANISLEFLKIPTTPKNRDELISLLHDPGDVRLERVAGRLEYTIKVSERLPKTIRRRDFIRD